MALFRLFQAIFAIFFVIWATGALIDVLGGGPLLLLLGSIVIGALWFGFLWDTLKTMGILK